MGLYKEAYETHVEFKTIHDSLLNESNYKELIQKEYQYKKTKDKEIYEFEQALNELKIKKQQVILYLQLGIIIFIVVFAIMLFRNYQLKSKVNKTLETKNVEIKHINEQLKKSNDTKDTLFSIIAHDLRSPFNNILGFSDLLKEELKGEEISKKYNDIIISSAQNTLILLDNLLNWAKCQKGQIRIDKETLNINALVSNAIIENNAKAELKGIKINSIVPDNLMLKLDKHTMSICINNLISNALKYTDKGGCVCVSTDHTSLGTSIIIQDNGAGMTEEQMGKLFKPDASYTTVGTDKEKGSGLGLILCKEFVERNGGTLNLESKVDNGTKVILSFQNE